MHYEGHSLNPKPRSSASCCCSFHMEFGTCNLLLRAAMLSRTNDLLPASSQASTSPMEFEKETSSSEEHGAGSEPSTSTEMEAS